MGRPSNEPSPTPGEWDAVRRVARDYIEGWYTGDAARMDRSLHDDLVKRTPVVGDLSATVELHRLTKSRMVELTRSGGGRGVVDPAIDVVVDDVTNGIACARTVSADFVDFLHLVNTPAGWKIVDIVFHDVR